MDLASANLEEPVAPPAELPVEPPIDEVAQAQAGRDKAAERLARGATHNTPKAMQPLPRPADKAAFDALEPGTSFIDPEGNTRAKPYKPTGLAEYKEVPEGADFLDPQGNVRTKPKYEGVDFTTQTLHDMAVNDKERRKALERAYPGKVQEEAGTGELYVDDNGKLRKPKGFVGAPGAYLTAVAAPTIGSIIGEVSGGLAGSAVMPGPGTFGGAVAGGAFGGAAGQGFNDLVMHLAGTYDRSEGEEAKELGVAGLAGGVGSAAGRTVAAVAPAVGGFLKNRVAKTAVAALGADVNGGEGLRTGIAMREKGVELVPLSEMFPESPHLINIAQVLDPAFRTQQPLKIAQEAHYEKTGAEILTGLGTTPEGSLLKPKAAVSVEAAGKAAKDKVLGEARVADQKLAEELAIARTETALSALGKKESGASNLSGLQQAAQASRDAANQVIKLAFEDIQKGIDDAMSVAQAGHNSGDLWWNVGEKLKEVRSAIGKQAKLRYDQATELAGNARPDVTDLSNVADDFLQQMPEGFQNQYPAIVKQIRDIVGVVDEHGQIVKEAAEPTFGQLHDLRTTLRSKVNWNDLTPGVRDGAYKHMQNAVDDALHVDAGLDTPLGQAAKFLDDTDQWYGEALGPLKDKNIQAVINGLESGLPADPQMLYNVMIREGRSDQIKHIEKLVGPSLWGGIKAADMQAMMDASKSLVPGMIDGNKFAQEVLTRHRNNMLEAVHGKAVNDKLLQQARDISALGSRSPTNTLPADTLSDVVRKAKVAADAAKEAADANPIGSLNKEMKGIEAEHAKRVGAIKRARKNDPLGFLFDPTIEASEAASKILDEESMLIAAAQRFGEKSPEWELLRQAYAKRILQGSTNLGDKLTKISPEIQSLMFPGVTLDQMQLLAKEMNMYLGAKGAKQTGSSIMAQAAVEHPAGRFVGKGGEFLPKMPGGDFGMRYALGKYYKFVNESLNNLTFLRWLERGLKGDPAAEAKARATLKRAFQRGGAVGAGVGEVSVQQPNQPVQ